MPNLCTVDEAVALVRPVDRIGFGLGPGIPDALLGALGARDDWEDLEVGGALCLNLYEVFTKPGVRYRCGFFGPAEAVPPLPGAPCGVGAEAVSGRWGRSWPGSLPG